MKKMNFFVLVAAICMFPLFSYAQEEQMGSSEGDFSADDEDKKIELNEYYQKWKADSAIILNLIADVRKYKIDANDSEVQAKERKMNLERKNVELNKRYHNTILSLGCVMVKEVKPEQVLSEYGKQQARNLISKLRKDPSSKYLFDAGELGDNPMLDLIIGLQLAFCKKCYKDTGRYEAIFVIPQPVPNVEDVTDIYNEFSDGIFAGLDKYNSPQIIDVDITFIINSKQEALQIKKGSVHPLKGKIKSIYYPSSLLERVEITLEK